KAGLRLLPKLRRQTCALLHSEPRRSYSEAEKADRTSFFVGCSTAAMQQRASQTAQEHLAPPFPPRLRRQRSLLPGSTSSLLRPHPSPWWRPPFCHRFRLHRASIHSPRAARVRQTLQHGIEVGLPQRRPETASPCPVLLR